MKCLKGCRFWVGTTVLAGVVLASSAQAAIVYVDAATSNTALAPSAGGGAWTTVGTDTASDNMWRLRPDFGQAPSATVPAAGAISTLGGTIYESTGNNCCDDVPRLATSASTPAGLKDVYAYFWADQNGSPWRLAAGLTDTASPLALFTAGGAPSGTPLPVDTGGRDGSNRILWRAYLGQSTAASLTVFVDDAPATSGSERTWYDGIGYENVGPIVPEPTSLSLIGFAAIGLLARRRTA